MLTGLDHIGRLQILPLLIKKYMVTENPKYLRQFYQICNDHKPKVKEFNRMVVKRMENIKKRRKKLITEHNQVPFPGLKNV